MRKKRFSAIPILFLLFALAAAAAEARTLQNGVTIKNPNANLPATVTYSWSGHFAGGGEV